MTGKVIRAKGKVYTVLSDGVEYQCEIMGKIKQERKKGVVVVGDEVDFVFEGDGPGGIEKVHPRRTKFSRPRIGVRDTEQIIATNIDQMVIVVSVAHPKFKQHLIDRLHVAAQLGELDTILVINKTDLEHRLNLDYTARVYNSVDVPVILTSATESEGIDDLRRVLLNKESILVGHSGVGKSSLLNMIQPGLKLRTSDVSNATDKGTHTTTAVELYPLIDGGFVVDTPGLKVLGIWDMTRDQLQHYFPEFAKHFGKCKFKRCTHLHEPECAVREAVDKGEIFRERYQSYERIYNGL